MAKTTRKKASTTTKSTAKTTKKTAAKTTAAKKSTAKKTVAKKTAAKTTTAAKPKTAKKMALPEKYTLTTMVSYVAEKHDLPKKEVKELFESVFDVVEAGVMAGARVPVGKMGKMYVKIRPARKARKGRNPLTGEEITIPAKRATKVPKFTFSKAFKESSTKAKVK